MDIYIYKIRRKSDGKRFCLSNLNGKCYFTVTGGAWTMTKTVKKHLNTICTTYEKEVNYNFNSVELIKGKKYKLGKLEIKTINRKSGVDQNLLDDYIVEIYSSINCRYMEARRFMSGDYTGADIYKNQFNLIGETNELSFINITSA